MCNTSPLHFLGSTEISVFCFLVSYILYHLFLIFITPLFYNLTVMHYCVSDETLRCAVPYIKSLFPGTEHLTFYPPLMPSRTYYFPITTSVIITPSLRLLYLSSLIWLPYPSYSNITVITAKLEIQPAFFSSDCRQTTQSYAATSISSGLHCFCCSNGNLIGKLDSCPGLGIENP